MVHEGALGLMGYYTGADLRALIADMDAGVRAMLGVYAEKTGRPEDELRAMVEAETWMVGQEIVDAGFADELETGGEGQGDGPVEDEGDARPSSRGWRTTCALPPRPGPRGTRVRERARAAHAQMEPPGGSSRRGE